MGEFEQKQQYPERTPPYSRRMGEDPYTDEKVSCTGEDPDFLQEKLSSSQFEYDGSGRMQIKSGVFEPYVGIDYRDGLTRTANNVDLGGSIGAGRSVIINITDSDRFVNIGYTEGGGTAKKSYCAVGGNLCTIYGQEDTDNSTKLTITAESILEDFFVLETKVSGVTYTIRSDAGGFKCDADFSGSYTDRHFTDKGYVVTSIAAHTGLTNNPHTVTKAQVGLSDVTNNAQVKKLGSSTVGNVPTWSVVTGDALADTYGVETTLVGNSGYLARADAIKAYVDGMSVGLQVKDPCRVATTANLDLDGLETIDGISVIADDRVYVKDQTLTKENGLYLCKAGAWTRTDDANTWAELIQAYAMIQEGTDNAGSSWVCNISSGGVLETDPIPVTQFFDVTTYSAGDGLELVGTQFSIDLATDSGLEFSSGDLQANFGTAVNTVAMGNHTHTGVYDNYVHWEADSDDANPVLEVIKDYILKFEGANGITTSTAANKIIISGAGNVYTAASDGGLSLAGNAFSVKLPGGSGLATSASGLTIDALGVTMAMIDGPIDVATGGTGLATLTSGRIMMGNGTGNVIMLATNTAFNKNFGGVGSATTVSRSDHWHVNAIGLQVESGSIEYFNIDGASKLVLNVIGLTGIGVTRIGSDVKITNTGATYSAGSGITFTGSVPTVVSVKPAIGGGLEVSGSGIAITAGGVQMTHIDGPVTVAKGGTGRTTLTSNRILIGNAGGIVTLELKNTGFNKVLGTGAGQVAEGNHNHTGVYDKYDNWTVTVTNTVQGDEVDQHPVSSAEDVEFKAGTGISLSWSPHQITITNAGTTYSAGDGIDIAAGVISIETATTTNLGGVTVGAGIEVNAGEITLGLMDGANIGGAKLGAGLEIVSDAIKVIYAGSGAASSASHSDHTHTGYDNYVDWNLWVGTVKKLDVTAGEDVDFVGTANEIDVDYVDAGHKVRIGLPDTVTVTTGYKVGSFTGLTVLKEFQTQVGATVYDHAVTIKGGIITGWSIQPVA